jgi:hypothetical protein
LRKCTKWNTYGARNPDPSGFSPLNSVHGGNDEVVCVISQIADITILPLRLCNRLHSNTDSKITVKMFPTPFSVLGGESDETFK